MVSKAPRHDYIIPIVMIIIRVMIIVILLLFLLFMQGDCWICMELMSISLDKFYKFVHDHLGDSIPEEILGKITVAVISFIILSHSLFLDVFTELFCFCKYLKNYFVSSLIS